MLALRSQVRRFVPNGSLRIDWGHPLANGLFACYVPGVSGGINLAATGGDLSFGSAATTGVSVEGPSLAANASAALAGLAGAAPASFVSATGATVYARSFVVGAAGGNNGRVASLDATNTNAAPFLCYGIFVASALPTVAWNTGGSFSSLAFPAGTWAAGTLKSLGATFVVNGGAGSVVAYDAGVSVATGNFGAAAPAASSPSIVLNGLTGGNTTFCNGHNFISCFWNRALSAAEMAMLNADPYGFLIPAEAEMPALFSAGGASSFTLAGAEGVFVISGQNAALQKALHLAGAAGTFTINGQAATLFKGKQLAGSAGSFVISGQAATELRGVKLAGSAGAFVINGGAATLSHGLKLAGSSGAFTINGQPATYAVHLSEKGATGAFTINGPGALITYTPFGTVTGNHSVPFLANPGLLLTKP